MTLGSLKRTDSAELLRADAAKGLDRLVKPDAAQPVFFNLSQLKSLGPPEDDCQGHVLGPLHA